jgi:hypothetical protein
MGDYDHCLCGCGGVGCCKEPVECPHCGGIFGDDWTPCVCLYEQEWEWSLLPEEEEL